MALVPNKRLGDVLIDCNLITLDQLKNALKEQKIRNLRLGETLISLGLVTRDDIIWALGNQLNISYISLNDQMIDKDIAKSFNEELIRKYKFLPIFKMEKDFSEELTVVMADPLDQAALEVIESLTSSSEIKISISDEEDIDRYTDIIFGKNTTQKTNLEELRKVLFIDSGCNLETLKKMIKDIKIEKFFMLIVQEALINRASEIFFEPFSGSCMVRFRIGNKLKMKLEIPLQIYEELLLGTSLMAKIVDFQSQDYSQGLIRVNLDGGVLNIYVAFIQSTQGVTTTFRLRRDNEELMSLDMFHLGDYHLKKLIHLARNPGGIVLVLGPESHLKRRFIYSFLDRTDYKRKKIVSIEESVTIRSNKFNQIRLSNQEKMVDYMNFVRDQEPDILYCSPVQSPREFEIASSIGFDDKLIVLSAPFQDLLTFISHMEKHDMPKAFFFSSLQYIVGVKKTKRLCVDCAEEIQVDEESLAGSRILTRGKGCGHCNGRGFISDSAVCEYFEITDDLREYMMSTEYNEITLEKLKELGYKNYTDTGLELLKSNHIGLSDFVRIM